MDSPFATESLNPDNGCLGLGGRGSPVSRNLVF
jgi:hypothetical protein